MTDLRTLSDAATPGEWCTENLDHGKDLSEDEYEANQALAYALVNAFRAGTLVDVSNPASRVKPLVWDGRQTISAATMYRVHIGYGLMNGMFALTFAGSTIGEFGSEEAAKAAAEAHHVAHVLSMLNLPAKEDK